MIIHPLYAVPQHASCVTEWLWRAFGADALPWAFFASIVEHSQTPGALPITFVVRGGREAAGHRRPVALRFNQPPGSLSVDGGALRGA